jgi:hypothetical protein
MLYGVLPAWSSRIAGANHVRALRFEPLSQRPPNSNSLAARDQLATSETLEIGRLVTWIVPVWVVAVSTEADQNVTDIE